MELNVKERAELMSILPPQGNFSILKIVKNLQMALSLTEEEHKYYGVKYIETNEGPRVEWNQKGLEEKEIEIGERATDLIVEQLEKLDKEKKLTQDHYSLYEKFLGGK